MYLKFKSMVTSAVDVKEYLEGGGGDGDEGVVASQGTPKELVKKVSDVVWSYLSRSYKADTPHIQSLYTYVLGEIIKIEYV
jgi:hypothetical protein